MSTTDDPALPLADYIAAIIRRHGGPVAGVDVGPPAVPPAPPAAPPDPSRAARLALAVEVAGLRADIDDCLVVAGRMAAARIARDAHDDDHDDELSSAARLVAYERARAASGTWREAGGGGRTP